jgi:hypothetical protein
MMSGRCYFDHGAHLCLHGSEPQKRVGGIRGQWRSPMALTGRFEVGR